jgi:hypothetical protein
MRLHIKGGDAWRADPEADELIRYMIDRFSGLARKHGLEPDDAGPAAFEAMRNPSVFLGEDPWGVIIHAVTTTIKTCQFADDALCSVETARRGGLTGVTPERFSDRDNPVWEHHQGFATADDEDAPAPAGPSIAEQAEGIAVLFAAHGWPLDATSAAVEVVLRRLAEAGSRAACYEQMRKDNKWRAITDLPPASWTGLLRLLLGNPADQAGITDKGRGILLRSALGETTGDLARDQTLAAQIRLAAPGNDWRRG